MAKLVLDNNCYPANMKIYTEDENFPSIDNDVDDFETKCHEIIDKIETDVFKAIKLKKMLDKLQGVRMEIHEK